MIYSKSGLTYVNGSNITEPAIEWFCGNHDDCAKIHNAPVHGWYFSGYINHPIYNDGLKLIDPLGEVRDIQDFSNTYIPAIEFNSWQEYSQAVNNGTAKNAEYRCGYGKIKLIR